MSPQRLPRRLRNRSGTCQFLKIRAPVDGRGAGVRREAGRAGAEGGAEGFSQMSERILGCDDLSYFRSPSFYLLYLFLVDAEAVFDFMRF